MGKKQKAESMFGPNPGQFETRISNMIMNTKKQHPRGERTFKMLKHYHPNSLAHNLAQLSTHAEAGPTATILLRKHLVQFHRCPEIAESTLSTVKNLLFSAIQDEEIKTVTKKLCDTVSKLASPLLLKSPGPEILPRMFQCTTFSVSPRFLQQSAFLMYIRDLFSLILNILYCSPNPSVKIDALSAVISFIQCLQSSSSEGFHEINYKDLLLMLGTLKESLNSGPKEATAEARKKARKKAHIALELWIVRSMFEAAVSPRFEVTVQHLAIDFMIILVEARDRAPGLMRRRPHHESRLFSILMTMLCDVENDPAWHHGETTKDKVNNIVAHEFLDRLAIALGGNTIVPVALKQFVDCLSAPEWQWQKHHAALIALAQITEACSDVQVVMRKNLQQVVNMVLSSLQHPHPRVRWAAINAIGQLSDNLGPDLQYQYHQSVLQALEKAMDDFKNPRVQAHAVSAVIDFKGYCTPEMLTPRMDGIVKKLLRLLQNSNQMLQARAIFALSSFAGSPKKLLKKHYSTVLPHLQTILDCGRYLSDDMLYVEAKNCILLIKIAVAEDLNKEDTNEDAKQTKTFEEHTSYKCLELEHKRPPNVIFDYIVEHEHDKQPLMKQIEVVMGKEFDQKERNDAFEVIWEKQVSCKTMFGDGGVRWQVSYCTVTNSVPFMISSLIND